MYVEIPPDAIAALKPHLEEGTIVLIKKFIVQNAKVAFRIVQGPYMIKLNRRTEFDGTTVYETGQHNPIIAIFVGTLWKGHRNETPYLSGTSACRWYINDENIEEIKSFWAK